MPLVCAWMEAHYVLANLTGLEWEYAKKQLGTLCDTILFSPDSDLVRVSSNVKELKAIFFFFICFSLDICEQQSVLPGRFRPQALRQSRYDVRGGGHMAKTPTHTLVLRRKTLKRLEQVSGKMRKGLLRKNFINQAFYFQQSGFP